MIDKISLKEAKKIKLLNRVEKKYLCTETQLTSLIDYATKNGFAIVCDGDKTSFRYQSIYCDSADKQMWNAHDRKDTHRQKFRIRIYDDGKSFIEIKDKNNGVGRKKRINTEKLHTIDLQSWIYENLMYEIDDLKVTLSVSYDRTTYLNVEKKERMTIDRNIKFTNHITGKEVTYDGCVLEIKRQPDTESSLEEIFDSLNIQHESFSKYYIGVSLTS